MIYKLCNGGLSVVGTRPDGATVSCSIEAPEYKQWVLDGGIPEPEFTAAELLDNAISAKWASVKTQWDALTVTTTALHTFAANEEAMKLMDFKANNMGSSAVILWVEDWASFNTSIVELKEALNLAADAHQTIFNSVFGV